eukprot:Sspe_Gene.30131::Locus_14752_Transcript_2_3_Confidence_0.500_Length_897::g.30131::m.30131
MAGFGAMPENVRVRPTKRPNIRLCQRSVNDHDLFDDSAPLETPHRMRKAVDIPMSSATDDSVARSGRKHIDAPKDAFEGTGMTHTSNRKDFNGENYDPMKSDRFQHSQRFRSSGNILSGESVADQFESHRPSRQALQQQQRGNILAHSVEPVDVKQRPRHENAVRHTRDHCPFAIDDGYLEPPKDVRPLHPGNFNHGDVLTGGAMQPQYAGRRL